MQDEPLRFKKSRYSGGQSDCVEVAHTLECLRDSKQSTDIVLRGNVLALIQAVKTGRLGL